MWTPNRASQVERIAALAREYGVVVSAISHSGKKRARQTAEILAGRLNPEKGIREIEGLAPLDDVTKLNLKAGADLMLVGHLPFMEKLTSYLVAGSFDRPKVLKFQNGGIVCLDRDPETDAWFIKWTLFPRVN